MRKGELECIHGVGHSANSTHGCDGCCFAFARAERERIIKLLEALTTHDLCMLGEHHEDWVNNNTRGIIEVLTEWDSEPVALIKGENK